MAWRSMAYAWSRRLAPALIGCSDRDSPCGWTPWATWDWTSGWLWADMNALVSGRCPGRPSGVRWLSSRERHLASLAWRHAFRSSIWRIFALRRPARDESGLSYMVYHNDGTTEGHCPCGQAATLTGAALAAGACAMR